MMWWLLQFGVFVAVLFSNIHYEWTPNAYLAAGIAWLAAYLASCLAARVVDWLLTRKARKQRMNEHRLRNMSGGLPR